MPAFVRGAQVMAVASALLAFCASASGAQGPGPRPRVGEDRAWVELTGRGAEARLVTSGRRCPDIVVDGRSHPMRMRAPPNPEFQVTVCEAALPAGAKQVLIGDRTLPAPPSNPRRILIFGDTGCRLKGDDVQNCDKPADWPFAQVARLAAAHHPDLVIHVGDYYYRESPCPAGRAGCSGSPWGDNWTTWDADFFTPAAPLLSEAPWVMARGNHEDCQRGGPGWFRLLDAARRPLECPSTSAPIAIDLGDLDLYVLDSSGTDDRKAPKALTAMFERQLDILRRHPPKAPAWIITHRPIWGLVPVARVGPIGPLELPINATEQAAARASDLAGVRMVVSGHIHHFASFSFAGDRPAQLIAGTGGDVGEPSDSPRFLRGRVTLDGMRAQRFGFDRYGFLLLTRGRDGWSGDFYDVRDRPIVHCRLVRRSLACRPTTR